MTEPLPKKIGPVLVGLMPGGILVRYALPPGVPDRANSRSGQVSMLRQSPALTQLSAEEREGLVGSLASTIRRAVYHFGRFNILFSELKPRAKEVPGEVFYDDIVECLHFEFQALCGAARVAIDELTHIVARRYAVSASQEKKKWGTSALITSEALEESLNFPEVLCLRAKRDWFKTLNAYRNTFFHSGWRHGSGYFVAETEVWASKAPARNALILPDRSSLVGDSRPHEWTWNDGETIDNVAQVVHDGLDALVGELCENHWGIPLPKEGRIPREQQPNMVVTLLKPMVVPAQKAIYVPFFSTRQFAEDFKLANNLDKVESRELRAIQSVLSDEPEFAFTLAGLEKVSLPADAKTCLVVVDPQSNADWSKVEAKQCASLDLASYLAQGPLQPLRVNFPGASRAFVLCEKIDYEWPTH